MAHAKFSPSNSKRWLNCTMSMILADKPQEEQSTFAARGTLLHDVAEKILLNEEYSMEGVLQEDIDSTVIPYVEYVRNLDVTKSFIELRVKILDECFGTADFVGYNEETKTLHVADLKAGQGVYVRVKNNTQIQIYAIGALKLLKQKGFEVEKVVVHICQPGMGNISSEEVELSTLKSLLDDIKKSIKAVNNSEGVYAPSEEACMWCQHKTTCPKLNEIVGKVALDDFEGVELSEKYKLIPVLKQFIKAVEAESMATLNQGKSLPGYKLVQGKGNRKWGDEKKIAFDITAKFEELEVYSKPKLLTVAQMEKTLKKNKIDFDLSEYIVRPDGAPKIVFEDSLEKEINKTAQAIEDFK